MKQITPYQYRSHRASLSGILGGLVLFLTACQTTGGGSQLTGYDQEEAALNTPLSEGLSSNYLMARHAIYANDLQSATGFFTNSLILDDKNVALLRHSFLTHYQSGNIEEAAEIARRMEALNLTIPLASEPALIEAVRAQDWEAVIALSDLLAQSDTSLVIAGVAKAWAALAQDQLAAAITHMNATAQLLAADNGLTPAFMEMQLAHLLEVSGARDEALIILQNLSSLGAYSSHIQLSIAAAYHRLGETEAARQIITDYLSTSFDKDTILAAFTKGDHPLLTPMTIERGLAQSILDTSWLDYQRAIRSLLLARAQLSLSIAPDLASAHFVIAQEYLNLNQYESAAPHLAALTQDSAYFQPSQLVYVNYLRRLDRYDEAHGYMSAFLNAHPDNQRYQLVIGDLLRSLGRYEEATPYYRGLLGTSYDDARLHRNLAVTLERSGFDEEAESYFLSSLALDPDDPYTLNYLGYWYADTNRNLDEAISYIEKAVELRPNSGFFADSLGWVHYRLGAYDDAVLWLEKAIQLEPRDPVIVEHLGDAYWRVGRQTEALYKWQHTLTVADDDEMIARVKEKLLQADTDGGEPLAGDSY